jgi:intermediate cleaving peptidase 55
MLDGTTTQALCPIMDSLRVIKSDAEVTLMREAGRISGRVYNKAMAQGFKMEKDLCAYFEYEFKRGGCQGSAYVPVVGGGKARGPLLKVEVLRLTIDHLEWTLYALP